MFTNIPNLFELTVKVNPIYVHNFDLDIEKKFLFFSSKNNKGDIHDMTAD